MAEDGTTWAKPESYDYEALQAPPEQRGQWEGSAKIYEWDGEIGDIGPEFPELETELFGSTEERKEVKGVDFMKLAQINVVQEGPVQINPIHSFTTAGLHPAMERNVELAGYEAPTPIQKYTIPAILQGYDVIGIAQTGSGKTAAYLIPILSKLMGKAKKLAAPRPNPLSWRAGIDPPVRAEPLVVIVVPTRELAIQIFNECRKFCYRTMLRPCVCYGGGPIGEQLAIIGKGCDVLVATPGRLIDFVGRPGNLTLRRVKYMVIDEADEMLQVDWEEDFQKILSGGDQEEGNVKYMLFSATFPKAARDLAKTYLSSSHVRFRVGRAGSSHENIFQIVQEVSPHDKREALLESLRAIPPCRTIIFVNNKRVADELDDFLFNMGLPCTSMHSDRTQVEREAAMRGFRAGRAPILIATGVSARGIDVRNVMHVINYDLPNMEYGGIEEYTHRIGRTGRIGHRGRATSFFTNNDEPIASVLTRTLLETNQTIPDFLESYVPEGQQEGRIKFETDSDFDENEGIDTGPSQVWGTEESTTQDQEGTASGENQHTEAMNSWDAPVQNTKSQSIETSQTPAADSWNTASNTNAAPAPVQASAPTAAKASSNMSAPNAAWVQYAANPDQYAANPEPRVPQPGRTTALPSRGPPQASNGTSRSAPPPVQSQAAAVKPAVNQDDFWGGGATSANEW